MLKDFQPIQEYKILITAAATTALEISNEGVQWDKLRARIRVKITDAIVKFGNSSVAASATISSDKLPAGNFSVPSGNTELFVPLSAVKNYVSIISEDGATATGSVHITVGTMGGI